MKKRKWREVCILGREIVSRLTGECRPVFRPTDEWSGRLSYIHNPQALGIIIIIIIILASSWLSSPSELGSSSYSINCHCTQNPRSFFASAYHINPENCNCLNQNSKKILLFLVFLYFSALFLPSVLTSHVLPFWNQNLSWQIIAPPPSSSSSSQSSSSSFHSPKEQEDQSALIITAVMPSVLFVLSSPSWWMTGRISLFLADRRTEDPLMADERSAPNRGWIRNHLMHCIAACTHCHWLHHHHHNHNYCHH